MTTKVTLPVQLVVLVLVTTAVSVLTNEVLDRLSNCKKVIQYLTQPKPYNTLPP